MRHPIPSRRIRRVLESRLRRCARVHRSTVRRGALRAITPPPGLRPTPPLLKSLVCEPGRAAILIRYPGHPSMNRNQFRAQHSCWGRTGLAKYDVVIIGSGPGGYVAAIRAAQWGLKDRRRRKRSVPRRHLPARRLHPHQSFPAPRRHLRSFQARRRIRLRSERRKNQLARDSRAQRQNRKETRRRHRPAFQEEQSRIHHRLGQNRRAGPRLRRKRRQDHRTRNREHPARHRFGSALAAGSRN